jgi:ubiquitin carboxyl-terminal hydrolase 9/24
MEGLDSFVQGEMLDGDNAFYCDKCDKKRDTLRRSSFKRLPNVMFIDLKRFEFNFDTMTKFKVNDYCSFPQELDLKKYTQDYLKKQDLLREMESKSIGYEELNEDQKVIYNRVVCDEYSQFTLSGIVVHQGTTESGHYFSYIKDR